jgi:hypothetical protein
MVAGNATVTEWLRSPIVYRGDPGFHDLLLGPADRVSEPALLIRHYAHVARMQWDRLGAGDPTAPVRLKGVFYCLRPAAALRWLRTHPGVANPPMRLQDLLADSDTPAPVVHAADELVTLKARTHELGTAPFPAVLRAFVLDELSATDLAAAPEPRPDVGLTRTAAAEAFRTALDAAPTSRA